MMLSSVTKEMELSTVRVENVSGEFSKWRTMKMEDDDQKPKLPVLLILGAGDYMRAKTSEKPRVGKMGEPVAERTKFGWTILSPGKELDYSAMLFAQTSQSGYEELCRLDVLGLADKPKNYQSEVYSEFQEQLTRSEEGRPTIHHCRTTTM